MTVRVAINGLGRIGRATLKIVLDDAELELVAANDIAPPENLAYLLKYDTVYGRYERSVEAADGDHDYGARLHLVAGDRRRAGQEDAPRPGGRCQSRADLDRGRDRGIAIRVPIPVGSIADITFVTERATSVDEVNAIFREEAESNRYRGILGVAEDPIVSADIVKDARASVVDLESTQVVDDDLVKVLSWYDNEWGYAAQMVREAKSMTAR